MTDRSDMTCVDPDAGARLHAYQLHTLSASEAEQFERHLFTCTYCLTRLERDEPLAAILAAHRAEVVEELKRSGEDFQSLVRQQRVASQRSSWVEWARHALGSLLDPGWRRWAVASGMAVVILFVFLARDNLDPSDPARHGGPQIAQVDSTTRSPPASTPPEIENHEPSAPKTEVPAMGGPVLHGYRNLAVTGVPIWSIPTLRGTESEADSAELRKARVAYRSDDYASAAKWLKRAADIRPDNPETWFYLGMAAYVLGNDSLAVRSYARAEALVEADSPLIDHTRWYRANLALRSEAPGTADSLLKVLSSPQSPYRAQATEVRAKLRGRE